MLLRRKNFEPLASVVSFGLAVTQDQLGVLLRPRETNDGGIIRRHRTDDMCEFVEERDDLCLQGASVKRSNMKVSRSAGVISHRPWPCNLVNIASRSEKGPVPVDRDHCSGAGSFVRSRNVGSMFYPDPPVVALFDDMFRSIFVDRKSEREKRSRNSRISPREPDRAWVFAVENS